MLSACAQFPLQTGPAEAKPVSVTPPRPVVLPKQDLTEEFLYEFLLAEVAGQRGELGLSTQAYLDLARNTRDPRIAQRATEVALFARDTEHALEAASLWQEIDPDSANARQSVAAMLINTGRLEQARPHLEKLIAGEGDKIGAGFMHLNNMLARQQDKQAVLKLVRELAAPYAQMPEAHFALAQAAWNAGDEKLANAEIGQAFELRPGWEPPALFRAQLLQRGSKEAGMNYLRDFLGRYPQARDVRLTYARLLVGDKEYQAAREQFQRLMEVAPNNAEVVMAVGLLSMQLEDLDAAEKYFRQVLDLDYKDDNAVRIYLGQISEKRGNYEEAAGWYGAVDKGEQYLAAQVKYAAMQAKMGRLDEARQHLQELSSQNNQQRVLLIQAEAQLLREAKQHQAVYDLLTRALEKFPNHPTILYERGMAAEKIGKLDQMEQDLRKLIQLKPDHAHAFNALGYSLADRTTRLDEAKQLVEQALKLAPDDPFILDSVGWVYFRMGKVAEALDYLKRAFTARPDPEIAAHLGEVLWQQGNRDEAQKTWADSLKENPDNEVLLEVIKRFKQ